MKNKFLFILSIILLLTVSSIKISAINQKKEIPTSYENYGVDIDDLIDKIDENLVYNYLEKLVSYGPRRTGTINCSRAAVFLYQEFKNMGLKSEIQRWEYQGLKSSNIVATIEGNDPSDDAIIILLFNP